MTTTIATNLVGSEVVASCLLGSRLSGTGASGVPALRPLPLPVRPIRERVSERPVQAPAVVAAAQADAYVFAFASEGADNGHKQAQRHTMWAFRGLEPWRDPA